MMYYDSSLSDLDNLFGKEESLNRSMVENSLYNSGRRNNIEYYNIHTRKHSIEDIIDQAFDQRMQELQDSRSRILHLVHSRSKPVHENLHNNNDNGREASSTMHSNGNSFIHSFSRGSVYRSVGNQPANVAAFWHVNDNGQECGQFKRGKYDSEQRRFIETERYALGPTVNSINSSNDNYSSKDSKTLKQ